MTINWSPLVDLVRNHQKFLLTTHVRPDPDGLGSQLGLASVLERMGKSVRMVISSVWPPRYTFLDPARRIKEFELPGDEYRDTQVVIVLDTGTWNQLGDFGTFMKTLQCPKVVIDHHLSQDDLGATRLVDPSAEATGRLVYEAMVALGQQLTADAANFLMAALATDTGWFRHKNTTAVTFGLGQKLVEAGADPNALFEQIYEQNTPGRLKLIGLVLQRLQVVDDGRVAFSELNSSDYLATESLPSDSEDLINYPRSIKGTEVGLMFMEQPAGGIKVSFRSREKIDVAKVAEKFGGGGHRLASGATFLTSMTEAKTTVLQAIHQALEEKK